MVKENPIASKSKKPLIAMKFGGTSVGNAERMKNVAEIVADHAQRAEVVVVVSAMGGVTDMLIRAANEASQGDRENWKNVRRELAHRHREVADQLLKAAEQAAVLPRLADAVTDFENLCSGFSLVREVTPRAMDTLSSLGEVMSAQPDGGHPAVARHSRGSRGRHRTDCYRRSLRQRHAHLRRNQCQNPAAPGGIAAARGDSGHHRLPRRHP